MDRAAATEHKYGPARANNINAAVAPPHAAQRKKVRGATIAALRS